ncbi:Aspartyl protease [Handroanthus impetiginosus]|uniref:Aspartyl protease n=1 Tax=Handroanthus impetiginosus TaxID=429701 RepID=A0A2G9G213_9LAMI|nr:Aspartyl protease [Handroanthus impetiginosus]
MDSMPPGINCFSQTLPLFNPEKSTSYKKMDQNHKLNDFFYVSTNGNLVNRADYYLEQSSSGIVSLETFTFQSNKGNPENLPSFISQMGVKNVKRFSHCLPKRSSSIKTTFLRFGTDVKSPSNLQKLKLFGETYRERLKLPKDTFLNGCMLDTGHTGSRLDTRAYTAVVKILTQHFDKFKLTRLTGGVYEGQLCYKMKAGFKNFPNMTFHFKGRNFFGFEDDIFCMTMYGMNNLTILGAFQMQDVRFVYDLVEGSVAFGAENCELDKA